MSVSENYRRIKEEINEAAVKAGRDPAEVQLVAVTKEVHWTRAEELYRMGQRDFGENRMHEALAKKGEAPADCRWHMIGTLQTNKARKAVGNFVLIHSVDSLPLARKLSACSQEGGMITRILLQANTSGETSKRGMSPEEWKISFWEVLELPGLSVEGLMTMAPLTEKKRLLHRCFSALRNLREELKEMAKGRADLPHLSMGMSHDFREAIAEGATIVRIGTALFEGD